MSHTCIIFNLLSFSKYKAVQKMSSLSDVLFSLRQALIALSPFCPFPLSPIILTSRMSLWCLVLSSSLFSRSLRAVDSSVSSSDMRLVRPLIRSLFWVSSLLALSRSSCCSRHLLVSSWASMEPLGSLCHKTQRYVSDAIETYREL